MAALWSIFLWRADHQRGTGCWRAFGEHTTKRPDGMTTPVCAGSADNVTSTTEPLSTGVAYKGSGPPTTRVDARGREASPQAAPGNSPSASTIYA